MANTVYFTAHKHLTPTDDYGSACTEGYMLAARFAEYLKANPGRAGDNALGQIVDHLTQKDLGEGGTGYLVGFFSEIEGMILRGARTCEPMATALAHDAELKACIERGLREERKV